MPNLRALLSHPQFRQGAREMLTIAPGIGAWGLVTGVAMVKAGLGVPVALAMSLTVYAGSAQLAALPLMSMAAPIWVVWATALCVNLRFVIFSAQLRPYVMRLSRARRLALGYLNGDLTFVLFVKRHPEPRDGVGQIEYFLGGGLANWLSWQVPSIIGIVAADSVPPQWGLGFAGVLALLGLLYALLTDRTTALAAVVAGGAAVAAFALPLHLNIVVAIVAAVCFGLLADGGGGAGRRRSAARRRRPESAA